ncbi:MAG: ethanolamine utilization protein EutN [Rhodothermaceae bacterium]|nr:ethanolamine utilization protein EutN [Rhodothermaceae bacterium]MBC12579.1 ethanolamine utilization protein EutN [Rhodothermaceae bacterium]
MYLARVTGAVVASQKLSPLAGQRLLVVRRLDLDGSLRDATEDIALDPGLSAGVGDAVLIAKEGAVVATLLDGDRVGSLPTPANVIIVAVVDEWSLADGVSG